MLVINEVQAEGHPTQDETDCTLACILLNNMDDVCASACGNKNQKLDYFLPLCVQDSTKKSACQAVSSVQSKHVRLFFFPDHAQ